MLARVNRGLDVQRTEAGRGRENHHVHAAIDDLLIRIETDELALLGDVDLARLILENGFQRLETRINFVAKRLAHRPQHHVAVRGQRLIGRAGAASTAADETDLQLVARVGRARQARKCERAGERAAGDHGGGGGRF